MNFVANNRSSSTIVGQAIPSVAPWQATAYFNKLECFCFNRQTLDGKQRTEMPLRFMVSRDLPAEINSLTLSYSFMRLNPGQKLEPGSRSTSHHRNHHKITTPHQLIVLTAEEQTHVGRGT